MLRAAGIADKSCVPGRDVIALNAAITAGAKLAHKSRVACERDAVRADCAMDRRVGRASITNLADDALVPQCRFAQATAITL